MPRCEIRPVEASQVGALAAIGRDTFISTFASGNNPQDLVAYLEKAFSHGQLISEIETPGSQFFFAQIGERIAGYLKLNTGDAQTENLGAGALEIERIYVDEAYQGEGVGSVLFQFSVKQAREQGREFVWLGVWEENHRAISFYKRQGFEPFGTHDFVIGEDVQTDILMRLKIQ